MTNRGLEHKAFGPPARSASLSEGPDYLLTPCEMVLGRKENEMRWVRRDLPQPIAIPVPAAVGLHPDF